MPLYATDKISASKNPFIHALSKYRKTRLEIEQFEGENNGTEDNNTKIVDACWRAMGDYQIAIQKAIDAANLNFSNNKDEQNDFRDWLVWNRKIIMSNFFDIANICDQYGEEDKAKLIREQAGKIDTEVVKYLTVNDEGNENILPQVIEIKIIELNLAENHYSSKPNKPSVKKNYEQRFCEFLRTLVRENLLGNWYKNEANKAWIQRHYDTLKKIAYSGLNEFENEWNTFSKEIDLIETSEERNTRLNDMVENSIILHFQWDQLSILDKSALELNRLLESAKAKLIKAKENLPSNTKRLGEFLGTIFGTILWPIIAPTLWVADKISGKDSFVKYNEFLKGNLIAAGKFACDHPFITAGIVLGILGTTLITFFTGGTFAAATSVVAAIAKPLLVSVATSAAGYGVAVYRHQQEIAEIEKKHAREIETLKNNHAVSVTRHNQKCEEDLKANKKIHERESKQANLDDVLEEIEHRAAQEKAEREFRLRQQARAKERNKANEANRALIISKNKARNEQEIANKIQNFMDEMNPGDIRASEVEYRRCLTLVESEIDETKKQQEIIEKKQIEGRKQLYTLGKTQQKLREDIEESKISSPSSASAVHYDFEQDENIELLIELRKSLEELPLIEQANRVVIEEVNRNTLQNGIFQSSSVTFFSLHSDASTMQIFTEKEGKDMLKPH
jgi:hypothetical protein